MFLETLMSDLIVSDSNICKLMAEFCVNDENAVSRSIFILQENLRKQGAIIF
jgi:hypothetical protein